MQASVILLIFAAVSAGVALGWLLRRSAVERLAAELAAKAELLRISQETLEGTSRSLETERSAREVSAREVAVLAARLETERVAAAERVAALQDSEQRFEKKMENSFASLASSALDANAQRLLQMSVAELDKQKLAANHGLQEKENSIASLLRPMKDSLQQLTMHSQQLEVQREGAYQTILAEVQNIQRSHTDLRRETTQLVQALRAPKVRGNWGEMQLRRCVEHSGMVEHASFDVEKFVRGEEVSVRPDLIVRLPNQRCIVIDAKTPLEAFLNAGACEEETLRQGFMREHAGSVRKHLDALSSKAYWNRFKDSPDFVVCFLPSEVLFSAALEQDPALLDYSASSNVLLATPTTLIALLKAVAYGWQQAQTARDADIIREIATKLYGKFAGLHDSLLSIGSNLRKAGNAYDDVINKAEGHGGLFSIARRLRELKIDGKELGESKPVAVLPRPMQHDDWLPGLSLAASEEAEQDVSN